MKIVKEAAPRSADEVLRAAWSSPETFAYLPLRTTVRDAWVKEALDSLPEEMHEDHFAILTTGSTGHPKLVVGNRRRTENLARVIHSAQDNEAVRETVLCLPLSYSYAFVNQWVWAHVNGRSLIPTTGLSAPEDFAEVLRNSTSAMTCMVGAMVSMLLRYFAGQSFPGVIRLNFAGDRFPQETLGDIQAMFPNATIYNNYGCAEAMPRLTVRPALAFDDPAIIGKPLTGIELRSGPDNALQFRSPYGACATVGAQGLKLIGSEDWVDTGDLGHALPSGDWKLMGREKEVFKRYGEKVSVAQIRASLSKHWKDDAAFFRERDPAGEDGVVLVLAPQPDKETVRNILQGFRADLPRTHWPLRIEAESALPTLPNGKVDIQGLAGRSGGNLIWRQRL